MKRIIVLGFALINMGCSQVPSDIEAKIGELVNSSIMTSKRWNLGVSELLTDIKALPDEQLKLVCLRCFADRLLETDLLAMDIRKASRVASVVYHEVDSILGVMSMSGATIEDVWDVRLRMLSWLRVQAKRLYGDGSLPKGTTRTKSGGLITLDKDTYLLWECRYRAYKMVTVSYDERLRFAERCFPDASDGRIDEARIPELKRKIEKFLGRTMRTPEQCIVDLKAGKSEFPKW